MGTIVMHCAKGGVLARMHRRGVRRCLMLQVLGGPDGMDSLALSDLPSLCCAFLCCAVEVRSHVTSCIFLYPAVRLLISSPRTAENLTKPEWFSADQGKEELNTQRVNEVHWLDFWPRLYVLSHSITLYTEMGLPGWTCSTVPQPLHSPPWLSLSMLVLKVLCGTF